MIEYQLDTNLNSKETKEIIYRECDDQNNNRIKTPEIPVHIALGVVNKTSDWFHTSRWFLIGIERSLKYYREIDKLICNRQIGTDKCECVVAI